MDTINVLLIDDSEETIETLSLLYGANMSFRVVGRAVQADDAMRKIEQFRPNLVSVDLQLGDENGFSLTQQIHARFPDIFVVMCTVMSDTATRQEARQNGVDYFVSKPMSMRELGRIRTAYTDRAYRSLYRHTLDTRHDLRNTDLLLRSVGEGYPSTSMGVERMGVERMGVERMGVERMGVERMDGERGAVERMAGERMDGERGAVERIPVATVPEFISTVGTAVASVGDKGGIGTMKISKAEVTHVSEFIDVSQTANMTEIQDSVPRAQTRMTQAELLSFLGSIAIGEDTEPLYARIRELEHENAALHSKLDAIQKLLRFGDE